MTPLKRTEAEVEWTEKTAQVQQRIAKLGLDDDYEPAVINAALIEYLHQNRGQELRDDFPVTAQEDET